MKLTYVYIIECQSKPPEDRRYDKAGVPALAPFEPVITYYIGSTNDPKRRLNDHLAGRGAKYLRGKTLLRMAITTGATSVGSNIPQVPRCPRRALWCGILENAIHGGGARVSEITLDHWKEFKHEILKNLRAASKDEAIEKLQKKLNEETSRAGKFFSLTCDQRAIITRLTSVLGRIGACDWCKFQVENKCTASDCSDYSRFTCVPKVAKNEDVTTVT